MAINNNDQIFDLVLCGHFLFSYSPQSTGGLMKEPGLDLAWHRKALFELQRSRHEYANALLALHRASH
ncbi:hypothetical protein [Synechococcus sp. UW140]|uniref:hypothetical protein n=1 Tax=Synechococcus sp. UW140 TaxID=368503 RepID=UPI0031379716